MYMSYSMSYTWYDVTCNVGICKSKWTLRDTSYNIRRMTGWALSYCGMRVAGCALYHKVVLHCDVTPRYAVTSLHVTLSRDFSPERHPAIIRHIHVNMFDIPSSFIVINVWNQGKTLCSPCISHSWFLSINPTAYTCTVNRCSSVGIATGYGLYGSGDRIPVEARFSAHVQTGPGVHPASCTMRIGSFPG